MTKFLPVPRPDSVSKPVIVRDMVLQIDSASEAEVALVAPIALVYVLSLDVCLEDVRTAAN